MSRNISDTVSQINDKINDIADLNAQIVGMAGSKGEKNALLDAQAQALKELRSMVNVSSIDNADGSINVYLSNGDPLVQGIESHPLTCLFGSKRPERGLLRQCDARTGAGQQLPDQRQTGRLHRAAGQHDPRLYR